MISILFGLGGIGPIEPSSLGFDPLSVAAWVGVAAPFIVALALRFNWSSQVKFWVAAALMVGMSIFAWWTTSYPAQWQMIATQAAIIFGLSQTIYWALKPTGILEWLEAATTYEPKHAADPVGPLTD